MRINFSSGHLIQEVELGLELGFYKKNLPVDLEVLDVGLKDKTVKLFVVSRYAGQVPLKERSFLVHPSDAPLPKNDFKYYWYVGTVPRKGLHVFELI